MPVGHNGPCLYTSLAFSLASHSYEMQVQVVLGEARLLFVEPDGEQLSLNLPMQPHPAVASLTHAVLIQP